MPLRETRTLVAAPEPGLYPSFGMSMEHYLALDAVNAGTLKTLLDSSPARADAARRVIGEDSEYSERGTAVHAAILEPDRFEKVYAALPEDYDGRTVGGKAAKAEIVARGRQPIPAETMEACLRLREKAWASPKVAELLSVAETETTAVWMTGHGDVKGKARADVLVREARGIVDLKSTVDASPHAYGRTAIDRGLPISAAWYADGFTAAGCPVEWWAILALECRPKEGHYAVALYTLDPLLVKRARAKIERALQVWSACASRHEYDAYPEGFCPLPVPAWAFKEE